jgi:glycosyltransferase involved in cell wall biosynthesis
MNITFLIYRLSPDRLMTTEFYRQDIEILESLGHRVTFASRLRDVPRDTDLVFLWWWNWLWLVGPVLKLRGIPICVTGSLEPEIYESYSWPKRLLIRWGMRFANRSVFVSRYMIGRLAKLMRLPSALYCPHIVLDEYAPASPLNTRTLPNVVFNIAWKKAANMRRKMLPELIEAFAIVKQRVPDAKLVLAGEPVDGQSVLEQMVRERSLGDSVEFLGKVSKEEKIGLLQRCGVYYQCSKHEGFGLAIAEAMACGSPVVVNRKTAIPEVVGDCGYYVADESPESIAEQLVAALQNPEASRVMGKKAAERIDRHFRFQRRRKFFDELLPPLVKGQTTAPGGADFGSVTSPSAAA